MAEQKQYPWLDTLAAGSTGYTTTATIVNFDVSFASAMPATVIAPAFSGSTASAAPSIPRVINIPPEINMYKVRIDLPDGHLYGIAKIMVQWSLQEWLLQQILFDLTTGDPKTGRLSVGFPRSEEAVNRIEQLAQVRSIILKSDTATLKKEVKRLEAYRDQVGHGIWITDNAGRWCVVVYKGNWEAGEWQGTSKRITPHAKPIDDADLAKSLEDIKKTIALTRNLGVEINAALAASPGKLP